MRVSQTRTTGRVSGGAKRAKKTAQGAGFVLEQVSHAANDATVGEVQPLGGVEALLALQGTPDPAGQRAKAVKRGGDLLDLLDELRLGLLSGHLPENKISQLARIAGKNLDELDDPGLKDVLEGIELRAKVELAKLGRY